jgi:hypothetical protein
MEERSSARFALHAIAASLLLSAAIYLSTGTMAPYAATDSHPPVIEPCHYLVNVDHYHFESVYRMIGGGDESWSGSVVLRRLLFPLIAYPLVMAAGLLVGGLIASIVVNVVAGIAFAIFVRRRIGLNAAVTTLWLLATYPGITYWAGLPYSYVAIVPGSLFGLILLHRLDERSALADTARAAFLLGVIFTAYDLFLFFGPAMIAILAVRGRWRAIVPAVLAVALPSALVAALFRIIEVPIMNSNTEVYAAVASSYLDSGRYNWQWVRSLIGLPLILISNAIYGNLMFLPLLALAGSIVLWKRGVVILALPEKALLFAGLGLFLFTNAAPPYYGWQMRGEWVARLYQPLVVVLLMIVARVAHAHHVRAVRYWHPAFVFSALLNASVAFGPVLMNPLAGFVYHKFYIHSPPESLLINMRRYGRRPLGFCDPSHAMDRFGSPKTPGNRPSFMYRYPPERSRKGLT